MIYTKEYLKRFSREPAKIYDISKASGWLIVSPEDYDVNFNIFKKCIEAVKGEPIPNTANRHIGFNVPEDKINNDLWYAYEYKNGKITGKVKEGKESNKLSKPNYPEDPDQLLEKRISQFKEVKEDNKIRKSQATEIIDPSK